MWVGVVVHQAEKSLSRSGADNIICFMEFFQTSLILIMRDMILYLNWYRLIVCLLFILIT